MKTVLRLVTCWMEQLGVVGARQERVVLGDQSGKVHGTAVVPVAGQAFGRQHLCEFLLDLEAPLPVGTKVPLVGVNTNSTTCWPWEPLSKAQERSGNPMIITGVVDSVTCDLVKGEVLCQLVPENDASPPPSGFSGVLPLNRPRGRFDVSFAPIAYFLDTPAPDPKKLQAQEEAFAACLFSIGFRSGRQWREPEEKPTATPPVAG